MAHRPARSERDCWPTLFRQYAICQRRDGPQHPRASNEANCSDQAGELRQQHQKVGWALSAEAGLRSQQAADRDDAKSITLGEKLLTEELNCTECHRFHDKGDLGSAPDLTGYGSREWLFGMIGDPQHERFYNEDHNDRMPSFAKDSKKPKANIISPHEMDLLVDWLRGEWHEPASRAELR